MMNRPIVFSLYVVLGLSACSSSITTTNYNPNLFTLVDAKSNFNAVQIPIYIASAESQLLRLQQQASKNCIAGQLAIARFYLDLAVKEHNASMAKDAFITLVTFDRQIRKIHCINQHIADKLGCKYTNKKVVLKRWYDEGEYQQCAFSATTNKKTKQQHILITETLHDFDQDKIKPIYYQALNKLVVLMKNYPKSSLKISGHTDSKGSVSYNMQLSKRRANSVAKYFTDQKINTSQIFIENHGDKSIREIEQSDVARVFNRYTTITLFLDTNEKE